MRACFGGSWIISLPEPTARSLVGSTTNMFLEEQRFASQAELSQPVKALWRSKWGPLTSVALTALPASRSTRIEPQPFRSWLCRRLRSPLPLTSRNCGHRLDKFGHHRTVCSRVGVLGKRLSVGVCGRPSVQGGRRTRFHQCLRPRFGPCSVQRVGQSPGGRDRRRVTSVAWCTTGHGHHPRVLTARRRFSTRKSCKPQRFRFAGPDGRRGLTLNSQAKQGRGGGRQVVGGDSPVPSWVGQGSCGFCATPPPRQSEGGVVAPLELSARKQCDKNFAESLLETRPLPHIGHMRC